MHRFGNGLTRTDRQHQAGGPSLHDLMQDEDRHLVEEVDVVDADDDHAIVGSFDERFDHSAHQVHPPGAVGTGPRGERTQRYAPR